jgi:hypothetical protein
MIGYLVDFITFFLAGKALYFQLVKSVTVPVTCPVTVWKSRKTNKKQLLIGAGNW